MTSHRADRLGRRATEMFALLFTGKALVIELHEGENLVGRDSKKVDVQINHESVSRVHCVISVTESSLYIRDLQSSNGIWIRGQRVNEASLAVGNNLRIGRLRAQIVRLRQPRDSAQRVGQRARRASRRKPSVPQAVCDFVDSSVVPA